MKSRSLSRELLADRAAGYDRTASFPREDFEGLFKAGLHAPTIPIECGGLGLGHHSDRILSSIGQEILGQSCDRAFFRSGTTLT
ncbi:MAG: acyl-CoA dehydrogenase family protein [Scytolyngbya sp. HA4215-MV1]|nr:acyl-CoA dehydrogenase family protein [Scytolyngbya sp. HA4215-MV1]